jgi:hypothetical protein
MEIHWIVGEKFAGMEGKFAGDLEGLKLKIMQLYAMSTR